MPVCILVRTGVNLHAVGRSGGPSLEPQRGAILRNRLPSTTSAFDSTPLLERYLLTGPCWQKKFWFRAAIDWRAHSNLAA